MKKLHILLTISLLAVCFLSCSQIKQDDVRVKSVESVEPNGGSKIGVTLLVENKYRKDIHIVSANMSMAKDGEPFLDAMIVEGFVIPAKGVNPVLVNVAYKVTDPIAVFGIVLAAKGNYNWQKSITLSGQAKVKVGVLSKTISIPSMSLPDALKMLESQGIDTRGLNFLN